MILLYSQYCPISVFFVSASYWFHSVPGGQNHMIISLHQPIEASNNAFKIDNCLF